ncbi:MAG TPA: hypothetical protein VEX37_07855 [Thermomicrobiales bacterium]|nr:hypothetical protein [Thermomicrobiales bacterium]
MPVKDTAREAAFAAIRAARTDIVRICREILEDPAEAGDEQRASERLRGLLAHYGFEVESGVAGLPTAFRATKKNHDRHAMRNGLRHGSIAILVPAGADLSTRHGDAHPLGLATALGAAIGISQGLDSEHGSVTVIGFSGDVALDAMARAGVFDEFDAVIGAQPATSGEGFCYTIDGTGETLAARVATIVVEGDTAAFVASVEVAASTLAAPNRIEIVSQAAGTVELNLTGRTSSDLLDLSATVQRIEDETPGIRVEFGTTFDDMIVNRIIARRVKTYADTLGYKLDKAHKSEPGQASGWGSVSHATPTFVLNFPFTTASVVKGTPEFAAAAGASESFDRAITFAECLCMAGLDVLRDMQFRSIADDQLVKALAARGVRREHRRWLGVHPVIKDPEAPSKSGKKGPKMTEFKMVRGPGMRDN